MFFVFVFNTLLAIVVTYKMSNTFEKLYNDGKKSDEENVDLGDESLYITDRINSILFNTLSFKFLKFLFLIINTLLPYNSNIFNLIYLYRLV